MIVISAFPQFFYLMYIYGVGLVDNAISRLFVVLIVTVCFFTLVAIDITVSNF